jgi:hypothetical protein
MPLPARISRNLPQPQKRQRDGMDRNHVANVGDCPCCVCGTVSGVHAHHLLRSGERGMALKSPDKYCIPLCALHHQELHDAGDEDGYLARRDIDGRALAAALWAERGNLEGMIRVTLRCLQNARLKRA